MKDVPADKRLIENERERQFAMKAGRLGTWALDFASGELTTSETCRINFGRAPDKPFSRADLQEAVHADDRDRMAAAIARSIAKGIDYDIDYRIVTPAG